VQGRIFAGLARMAAERAGSPVFGAQELSVADSGHPSVLVFHKQREGTLLTVVGNFSEEPVVLPAGRVSLFLAGRRGKELLSGRLVLPEEDLALESCDLLWILS
jgi:hypothetical protein